MFEQTAGWSEYYRELEPKRRRVLLERLCAEEPDDGANAYRRILFEARHTDPKVPGHEVDRMLFECIDFQQLYRSARIFRGNAVKSVRRAIKELRLDLAGQYGEAGTGALYWEIRNAAARYLSSCSSPSYNRRLFGLAPSKEGTREERVLRDIWQMSEGLALRTGLEAEMAIWNRAVVDAYCAAGNGARERYEDYLAKSAKR